MDPALLLSLHFLMKTQYFMKQSLLKMDDILELNFKSFLDNTIHCKLNNVIT